MNEVVKLVQHLTKRMRCSLTKRLPWHSVIMYSACGLLLIAIIGWPTPTKAGSSSSYVPGNDRVRSEQSHNNVILISVDTLRADHLGTYGYVKDISQGIDSFSRDSILFKNAIAQAPDTLRSHASMFTSLIPTHHGASRSPKFGSQSPLPKNILTLAEILKGQGYSTVSYNDGGQVAAVFGLNQGFDIYKSFESRKFSEIFKAAIRWLENHRTEKFFMFLHSYEVHVPYTPEARFLKLLEDHYSGHLSSPNSRHLPSHIHGKIVQKINERKLEMSAKDLEHIINTYDAEIMSMDESFDDFIEYLKTRGIYDDTIIVFTSDHGEEFYEHGWVGQHSHTLYDELLKVPLIIKLPNSQDAGEVVESQVRSIDIAPTVLEILGIDVPSQFEGTSLLGILRNKSPHPLMAVSERGHKNKRASIRTGDWKYYQGRLYNILEDPSEQFNLSIEYPRHGPR